MSIYKRKFEDDIHKWYLDKNPDALIVQGARQVGKTTGILNWANTNNIKMLYIDLIRHKELAWELCSVKSYEEALKIISIRMNINPHDYEVIFLDEIQVHYDLLYLSRIFKQQSIRLICSGSLLGLRLASEMNRSDVGSKQYLRVYPLDFEEFLIWTNNQILLNEIDEAFENKKQLINAAHQELNNLLLEYLIVGGMPSVVATYLQENKIISQEVYNKKKWILKEYELDNHNNEYTGTQLRKEIILNMESIFEKIPLFLCESNKRFIIDSLGKNIRYKNIEKPLTALVSSNIVIPSYLIESPSYPLKLHKQDSSFKLYYSDIGLLTSQLNITLDMIKDWSNNSKKISGLMGGVIENYVAISLRQEELYYFKKSIKQKQKPIVYEIDYLFNWKNGSIVPCEVKSNIHQKTRDTSFNWFKEEYKPELSIFIGPNNLHLSDNEWLVPLYAIHKLRTHLN